MPRPITVNAECRISCTLGGVRFVFLLSGGRDVTWVRFLFLFSSVSGAISLVISDTLFTNFLAGLLGCGRQNRVFVVRRHSLT